MKTRTVSVLARDFDEYAEYLSSEGWPIISTRSVGYYIEVTFAYAK